MGIFDKLERLESRLQSLIEGSAARLFPDFKMEEELAHRLVEALQAGTRQNSEGKFIAPNQFTVTVHSGQASRLMQEDRLLSELTGSLQAVGNEAGLIFLSPPVIQIEEDREVALNQIRVSAVINLDNLSRTTDILVDYDTEAENLPENAYLIIDGTQIEPLNRSVINIGRRPDNQIVIEDPRISRLHAQIRAIKGRFVIFDLDSKGGTFVNSQRVNQCTLYPGDVINLAGYPIIYGQDALASGETIKYTPGVDL